MKNILQFSKTLKVFENFNLIFGLFPNTSKNYFDFPKTSNISNYNINTLKLYLVMLKVSHFQNSKIRIFLHLVISGH